MAISKLEKKIETLRQQIVALDLIVVKYLQDDYDREVSEWLKSQVSKLKGTLEDRLEELRGKLIDDYKESNARFAAALIELTAVKPSANSPDNKDYGDEATCRYMQGLLDDEDDVL